MSNPKRKTILFVSNNQNDHDNCHRMLSLAKSQQLYFGYDFKVLRAHSCDEAFSQLKKNPIDCILLNYDMPNTNGVEFTKQLYAQSRKKLPPIIIVTSGDSVQSVAKAMQAGISDFLIKDETTPHVLFSTVKHCIDEVLLKNEIGERKAQVKDLTYHDRLTALPNRFFFDQILKRELARAERAEQMVSLLLVDIDDFKHINDTLGHPAGDEVIHEFAKRLENVIRRSDILARIDGDGFAVIAPQTQDPINASRIAEKISHAISKPFKIKALGEEVFLTCSIGISDYPNIAQNTVDLIRSADAAMNEAKESGKNTISFFKKDINDQYVNYIKMVKSLKKALTKNELYLRYQPKYEVATNKIIGAEALLRWDRDDHKRIPPSEFIPVAERSRLMPQIGSWVFEEAIKQLSVWRQKHKQLNNFTLAINLSPYQITKGSDEFLSMLKNLLYKYNIMPDMIEVEITETALMQRITNIQGFTKELSDLGVKVAIDDFGTGFSSLERLKNLHVNTLKIDKSFIQGIESNSKDAVIARTAINLGQNLGLRVVAEGVETDIQLKFIKDNHCDDMQGFKMSKPINANSLDNMLD